MPITFLAAVKSFRSDQDGESVIAFSVPRSDKTSAMAATDLIEEVLSITVCRESELRTHAQKHGRPRS